MRTLLAAVSLSVMALACSGGSDDGPTVTTPPNATEQGTRTPTPAETDGPLPPVLLEAQTTFFGADAGDGLAAIAAGDFNGDGAGDLAIGAALADGRDNEQADAGEVYIFTGPFAGGALDARSDYVAVVYGEREGDQLGRTLTAGDFDGDGVDDIAMAAPMADGGDGQREDSGEVYVLAGSSDLGPGGEEIDAGDEPTLGRIEGADPQDSVGFSMASADVDGDGVTDLVLGALKGDGPDEDREDAGEVYVVTGGDAISGIDLATETPELTIFGADPGDKLGESVGAGDVNGDGVGDVLPVGTFAAGPDDDREAAGETYVIAGPVGGVVDLAEDTPTATIVGVDPGDQLGHSIATGDVNGDGADDILLGAVSADGRNNDENIAGEVALVLGSAGISGVIDVAAGDASAIVYGSADDRLGRSVAVGDVNGDGLADLLAAAPKASEPGGDGEGIVYVMMGSTSQEYPSAAGEAEMAFIGLDAGDNIGHQSFGMRALWTADLDGDGRVEMLIAGPAADGPDGERDGAGEVYIVMAISG